MGAELAWPMLPSTRLLRCRIPLASCSFPSSGVTDAAAWTPMDAAPIQARRFTRGGALSGKMSCRNRIAAADSKLLAASAGQQSTCRGIVVSYPHTHTPLYGATRHMWMRDLTWAEEAAVRPLHVVFLLELPLHSRRMALAVGMQI